MHPSIFVRALSARETESPDFVSLLLFAPEHTRRLIDAGEWDVKGRVDEIRAFLGEETPRIAAAG